MLSHTTENLPKKVEVIHTCYFNKWSFNELSCLLITSFSLLYAVLYLGKEGG